jgi:hypothetical protein
MEMARPQARAAEKMEAAVQARVAEPQAALAWAWVVAAQQVVLTIHVLPRSPTNRLRMIPPKEPLSQVQAQAH